MTNRSRTVCKRFVCGVVAAVCAVLIVTAFIVEAHADTFLNVNVAAHHYDRKLVAERNFNEQNLGLGLEFTKGNKGLLLGEYKNSIHKTSWYALASYSPLQVGNFSAGVIAGVVTGYAGGEVKPVVGLLFTAQFKNVGANIVLTPSAPAENCYGFAGLQLRIKL